MERAIHQIEQLIQHHENQLAESIKLFESSEYMAVTTDEPKGFVIRETKRIYAELIDELREAIEILKMKSEESVE